MNVVIVGCGRVGSELALNLRSEGHAVTIIDTRVSPFARLGEDYDGNMVVGNGIDESVLRRAGVDKADAFVAVTPGDNRNIMSAQIAKFIFHVPRVITRIKDPIREEVYRKLGLETICSTRISTRLLHDYVAQVQGDPAQPIPAAAPTLPAAPAGNGAATSVQRPYILIIGGGMVGYHLTKHLLERGHEVTLVEKDPAQVEWMEHQGELGTASIMVGDGDEMAFLATTGIERAGVVIATTGDDEDNLVVCQLAKEEFHVPRTIARVNNPVTVGVFTALGIDVPVSATDLLMGLIEAELSGSDLVRGVAVKASGANLVDMALPELSAIVGHRVADVPLPHDDMIVCIVRGGAAVMPAPDVIIEAGDELIVYSRALDVEGLRESLGRPVSAPG
ncbi:MAG: NAD-binding protein [Candidatus Dormibacteria bacterium]